MPENGRWCSRLNHTGWTVVFAFDTDLPVEAQDAINNLSKDGRQYLGALSETNMRVLMSHYDNGEESWAIDWKGVEGFKIENLPARGSLPVNYEPKGKMPLRRNL